MRAEVDCGFCSTGIVLVAFAAFAAAAVAARAPVLPSPNGPLDPRFAALPSTDRRLITMPSVTSAGTQGAACGALPRKWLGSNRSPITDNASGLLLWIVTRALPINCCVDGSSETSI